MENITDADEKHAKNVWSDFELKKLGGYHDLHVQIDASLLRNEYENFRNKYVEIYEAEPAHFLSAPESTWQACVKKTYKFKIFNQYWYATNGRKKNKKLNISHAIHRYSKANNKYTKVRNKNKESSYLMYSDSKK